MNHNLSNAVYRHSLSHPHSLAVATEGQEISYGQLAERAAAIAAIVRQSSAWSQIDGQPPRVGILASRSAIACLAVLGASWAGATYIPIGTKLPEERILTILSLCKLSALIVDAEGAKLLTKRVLSACPPIVLLPNTKAHQINKQKNIKLYDIDALPVVERSSPATMKATDAAYIIFTSGTTGVPKGVIISCGAIRHYIETVTSLLDLQASDRAIETLELTFDVSLHNMFTTWEAGASLHVLPASRVMSAVKFARDRQLTIWFSVPSLAGMLKQIKALAPNALPDLRISVFGGEPLPKSIVSAWQLAAPNSIIENFYGPTEVTVFCLRQSVTNPIPLSPDRDFVSIGLPISGNEAAIVDASLAFVASGVVGELATAGVQLSDGYLNAPKLTEARFPIIDGKRWYLTGDLAMQDSSGYFHCLGRIDNQVKILGHRVELEEIDSSLRTASKTSVVATVAWPVVDGITQGLVAFVGTQSADLQQIIPELKTYLPSYMVPNRIIALDDMPFNQSGKIDRQALIQLLNQNIV
jgi:D-alanine--poly(phosphoribitol) ligase subunit 1